MPDVSSAVRDMHRMEALARSNTGVHRLHPVTKLLTVLMFLIAALSFERHAFGRLLPLFLFPVLTAALADLPWKPFLKRLLFVEPFVIGIGILNPLFDQVPVPFAGFEAARGWFTFLSLFLKTTLTVLAALQLIASTGMERLLAGLHAMGLPRVLVLQVSLTYRYLTVLAEEAGRLLTAYSLRAPGQKGIRFSAWGSLAGMLLLRSFDRAQRIHHAMQLRGYDGHVPLPPGTIPGMADAVWFFGWSCWFALVRFVDLPLWLGRLMTGG